MTFPPHINEMHDEDFGHLFADTSDERTAEFIDVLNSVNTGRITYTGLATTDAWEMPEIQHAGEFTTLLPRNELMAHVMNCDKCESDAVINVHLSSLFRHTANALSGENMRKRARAFGRVWTNLTARIHECEQYESDTYASLISRVNLLHEDEVE